MSDVRLLTLLRRVHAARCYLGIAAACLLSFPCQVCADQPIDTPKCALRLSVEVSPDVPNPADGGFLSSLLGNHPGYQLFLLQVVDDTHVNLQLQGPGPAEACQAVVESKRNDGRVLSVDAS
jgi:hypothetical protein